MNTAFPTTRAAVTVADLTKQFARAKAVDVAEILAILVAFGRARPGHSTGTFVTQAISRYRIMPYTAAIEDRIVHISWEGIVSQKDLDAVDREIPRIAAALRFAPHVLHTFAAVKDRTFEPLDVFALSQRRSTRKIPAPVRSALVVKSPEARRVAEVFLALNRSPNLTMETFTSEKAARAWLTE